MNTLWFWFDKKTRRHLHGTPEDVVRKCEILNFASHGFDGIEIFIIPSKLKDSTSFNGSFFKKFSKLKYTSVHIGDTDADFLDSKSALDDLERLARLMDRLESTNIVLHAHHLQRNRLNRKQKLLSALGQYSIMIENNGFDNPWGGSLHGLKSILRDCPEFTFCIDIAHIKDFSATSVHNFITDPQIYPKIREIHYSYSTHKLLSDPYEAEGFKGYGPFHALFSVLNIKPSDRTKQLIETFPVVMEGILPLDSSHLRYLFEEADQLK